MTSLRARLFLILVATTGVIWLAAAVWTYVGTKRELERVLDNRLQEAARMVSSLVRNDRGPDDAASMVTPPAEAGYQRQLSCQIWSLGGRLVAASGSAPSERLTEATEGFSNTLVGGESWRVYATVDAAKGVRVLVGDRLGRRDELVHDLVLGLVAPALLMLPLFALLIWLSVAQGLAPLGRIAAEIKARSADDLTPIRAGTALETRPLTDAMNGLLGRLDAARCRERDVTAYAAHELRTPLAGIRTQAQIARMAQDGGMRLAALDKIIQGVDRTARLTNQLLVLARLDADASGPIRETVAIGPLLREIDRERARDDLSVAIDRALDAFMVRGAPDSLRIALRNLHENACAHSPAGGRVTWKAAGARRIAVEDEGPGIPPDELTLVARRFYRGRLARSAGSGLGLAIVQAALTHLGGHVSLENRGAGGLAATLAFPETDEGPA